MVQRLKERVRGDIVAAAVELFATDGYATTTIAKVAERAGVSTGNVYRYFAAKDSLFAAAVPEDFAATLKKKTRSQIEALHHVKDIDTLHAGAPYRVIAEELLEYSIANRERVVILLGNAAGTPYATFETDFRKKLVEWAIGYVRATYPVIAIGPRMRFALDRIYAGFLSSLAQACATFREPAAIREAVAHLSAYHQGGLKRLFEEANR